MSNSRILIFKVTQKVVVKYIDELNFPNNGLCLAFMFIIDLFIIDILFCRFLNYFRFSWRNTVGVKCGIKVMTTEILSKTQTSMASGCSMDSLLSIDPILDFPVGEELYEFDPNRPPRNKDVLLYCMSRTRILRCSSFPFFLILS